METTGVILFYEKCRLCLASPGEKPIFETQGLQEDIIHCTGVKILRSDNLPEKICSNCLKVVLNSKALREMVVTNDKYLKTLFLNDHDDDSRETVCLEYEKTDKPTQSKKRKKDSSGDKRNLKNATCLNENDDDSESLCPEEVANNKKSKRDSTGVTSSDSQTNANPVLKVRKDLFEATTTTSDTVKVRNIEDYKKYKERIKLDPDFVVEYECETCEKNYESYKKLYLHSRQHNKKYVCPLDACGKSFSTKGDLEKHLRTHTGVRPYTCEICDKTFTQQGTLKHHKENVHFVLNITGL
ncbi:hypothetical protein O0L34_g15092 [Tuta absoluta]|nr:hypothetical protein O0L34_g15092 [Tuta absoluta]